MMLSFNAEFTRDEDFPPIEIPEFYSTSAYLSTVMSAMTGLDEPYCRHLIFKTTFDRGFGYSRDEWLKHAFLARRIEMVLNPRWNGTSHDLEGCARIIAEYYNVDYDLTVRNIQLGFEKPRSPYELICECIRRRRLELPLLLEVYKD